MRNIVDLKKQLVYTVNGKNEVCAIRDLNGQQKPLKRQRLSADKRNKTH